MFYVYFESQTQNFPFHSHSTLTVLYHDVVMRMMRNKTQHLHNFELCFLFFPFCASYFSGRSWLLSKTFNSVHFHSGLVLYFNAKIVCTYLHITVVHIYMYILCCMLYAACNFMQLLCSFDDFPVFYHIWVNVISFMANGF